MQISRRSWHYRLVKLLWGETYEPRDLCGYVWRGLVFGLVLWLAFITMGLFIGGGILFLVGYFLWKLFSQLSLPSDLLISGGSILASLVLWWFWRRQLRRPRHARTPSLLVAYLRAKKQRYCPRITFIP